MTWRTAIDCAATFRSARENAISSAFANLKRGTRDPSRFLSIESIQACSSHVVEKRISKSRDAHFSLFRNISSLRRESKYVCNSGALLSLLKRLRSIICPTPLAAHKGIHAHTLTLPPAEGGVTGVGAMCRIENAPPDDTQGCSPIEMGKERAYPACDDARRLRLVAEHQGQNSRASRKGKMK